MTTEEYGIAEAEKAVNRKIVAQKIADAKKFFNSATYKAIVGDEDEDDDVDFAGYEEDKFIS